MNMFLRKNVRRRRKEDQDSALKNLNINHQVEKNMQWKALDKEKPGSHQEYMKSVVSQ